MSSSESQLYVDSDPEGTTSDLGPDLDSSTPSVVDPAEVSVVSEEYISSRGVRFTQQQQHKDGELCSENSIFFLES